jgi:hypothetical protein
MKLEYFPDLHRGKDASVVIDEELTEVDSWDRYLIGYFLDGKMPFPLLLATAKNNWKDRLVSVKLDASGLIIFQFTDEQAKLSVLEDGPWFFSRKYLVLKNWQRMMKPVKEHPSSIPVWVKLLNLPWELWNRECISRIASTIGRPIHVDQATAKRTRTSHARVCVEIDASIDLPHEVSVTVGGDQVIIPIQYQVLPQMCDHCKVFGHPRCVKPVIVVKTDDSTQLENQQEQSGDMGAKGATASSSNTQQNTRGILVPPTKEEWQVVGRAKAFKLGGISALEVVTQLVPVTTIITNKDTTLHTSSSDDDSSVAVDEEIEVLDPVSITPNVEIRKAGKVDEQFSQAEADEKLLLIEPPDPGEESVEGKGNRSDHLIGDSSFHTPKNQTEIQGSSSKSSRKKRSRGSRKKRGF